MEMAAMNFKQFEITEMIPEPMFRYVPDRETIQRLITRCSNMKDDLAEFDIYDKAQEDGQADGEEKDSTVQRSIWD